MASKLRVVMIAPEVPTLPALGWIREIGAIEHMGVDFEIVGGTVNEREAAEGLRRGADIVIWSGHGVEGGVLLTNGRAVSGKWIAVQARARLPRVVILAVCCSAASRGRGMAGCVDTLARMGINAIGFPCELRDNVAVAYTVEFVRAMVAGGDVGVAHEVACEAAAALDGGCHEIILAAGLSNGYRRFEERLARVERLVELIARKVGVDVDGG